MTDIATELWDGKTSPFDTHQIYNGLDCCVTHEVWREVSSLPQLPDSEISYNFAKAMQAPALEMMLRGIKVDTDQVQLVLAELESQSDRVQSILDRLASAVWGRGLNPGSYKQKSEFFYGAMGLPEQHKFDKGERKVTTDRDALERLSYYLYAEPIINCVLKLQELTKKISVLRTEIDPDERMRTSYNVVGTETGRWSSSANVFNSGTNLQNITGRLRRIFIPDHVKKFAYIDLSQAESRVLGFLIWCLFQDPGYLDACEASDLHTYVAKLVWPRLGWTGDPKADRALAERIFYRDFSYRDMSKRGGHATNYWGKPPTVSKHLKVNQILIEDFQEGYLQAFPGIPRFWRWVAQEIQVNHSLTTILGRQRDFFGRASDDATLREAIAFLPQSIVGELLNLALWRVWKKLPKVEVMAQLHDAILIQYDERDEEEVLPQARALMATPLTMHGRTLIIPSDIEVGWNWAKFDPKEPLDNPFGLIKWKGKDERSFKKPSRLDIQLHRVHG